MANRGETGGQTQLSGNKMLDKVCTVGLVLACTSLVLYTSSDCRAARQRAAVAVAQWQRKSAHCSRGKVRPPAIVPIRVLNRGAAGKQYLPSIQ
jgi:hypothetical protein